MIILVSDATEYQINARINKINTSLLGPIVNFHSHILLNTQQICCKQIITGEIICCQLEANSTIYDKIMPVCLKKESQGEICPIYFC